MQRRAPGNEGVKRSPYHKPKRTKKPYHSLSPPLAGMQACHARPTATTACKTTPRAGLGIPPGSFTLQGAPQNLTLLAAAWSHRRRLLTASEVPKTATSSKIPHCFCLTGHPRGTCRSRGGPCLLPCGGAADVFRACSRACTLGSRGDTS